MSDELCFLSVAEAGERIRGKTLSPVELTEAFLHRIAEIDPQLDAYLLVTADLAREQAQNAEAEIARGRYRGPLHGIPFAVKDIIDTAGIRTTAHSRLLEHNVPECNASSVQRLQDAGAILLGKTATHEFAHGGPSFDLPWPPARNPWNPLHFSGGSSSGSAAAVAAGLATCALGTDTGGSVRSPSWLSGLTGLKPTFGLIGRSGVIPFSSSCDHVGPMARTAEDCALLTQVLAGHDRGDPGSAHAPAPDLNALRDADLRGLRVGVVRHFWEDDLQVSAELVNAFERALEVLRDLGATIETVRLRSLHEYYAVRLMLTESELFALHQRWLQTRVTEYGHHFLSRCLPACLFTSADYINAQRQRRQIIGEMQPIYGRYDALLTVGAGPAPSLRQHKAIGSADKFLRPGMGTLFSVTGAPALALPCGFSEEGLPLGFQIAGRPFEDAKVLRIGHAYQQATQWSARRPQLKPGAVAPPVAVDLHELPPNTLPAETRALVDAMAARAGLDLPPLQRSLLYETAPYALQLVERIRRDIPWAETQAGVFSLWENSRA